MTSCAPWYSCHRPQSSESRSWLVHETTHPAAAVRVMITSDGHQADAAQRIQRMALGIVTHGEANLGQRPGDPAGEWHEGSSAGSGRPRQHWPFMIQRDRREGQPGIRDRSQPAAASLVTRGVTHFRLALIMISPRPCRCRQR
jgi:hypothetical protein